MTVKGEKLSCWMLLCMTMPCGLMVIVSGDYAFALLFDHFFFSLDCFAFPGVVWGDLPCYYFKHTKQNKNIIET